MSAKKSVTSKDVAKAAGVSQSTVSMILNNYQNARFTEATRRKVMEACVETGYRTLAVKNTATSSKLLLIVSPYGDNQEYAKLANVIQQHSSDLGYTCLVLYTFRDPNIENSILRYLKEIPFAGIIFLYQPENMYLLTQVEKTKPTVSVYDRNSELDMDAVELDSLKVGRVIAEHLLGLGHVNVAYVATAVNAKYVTRLNRLQGIKKTYEENGYDPEKCIRICTYETEHISLDKSFSTYEAGFVLTNRAVERYDDVTAFIGINDMICFGIIDALQRRKLRIPQDYSVCGCDNVVISGLKAVSLTSVEHFGHLRARDAVDMLMKKINDQNSERSMGDFPVSITRVEYEPKIVARASTGFVNPKRRVR